MSIAEWKKVDTVAVVTMTNGENRHNLIFANTMLSIIDEIVRDKNVFALVITSNDPKNFCLGVDVEWLGKTMTIKDYDTVKKWLYKTNDTFKALLSIPIPTIAAISGHAFGNGAIMSCACDFRYMRYDKGFFCLPEVNLGIPFLPSMIALLKKSIPENKFNEFALTGKKVAAKELEEHYIINKACTDHEELMKEAIDFAKTFKKKHGIFGEIKRRKHKYIFDIMEKEDTQNIESLTIHIAD